MSWSQYPLDESLERAYCTEYFGEIPESSTHNSRESFAQSSGEWFVNTSAAGSTRVATGNAAMALGAGRAAGLIPQLGAVQAFNRVRTSALPSPKLPVSLDPSTSKNTDVQPKSTNPPTKFFSQSVNDLEMPTIMLLEPQQFGTAAFTFPGLPPSLPPSQVANHSFIPKIDPCSVGFINSNPSKHFELQVSDGNIERDGLTGPCQLNALAVARTEEEPEIVTVSYTNSRTPSSMLSRNVSSVRKQNSCAACVADEQKFEQNCSYTSWSHASGAIKSAEAGLRERQQLGLYIFHTPELTETSSERADNIVGQGARMSKWATTPIGRRDASELEESVDCQCEDRQDEFIELNKIELGRIRGKTSKRSRTAEVHNLSERRRRDRINEKMRALQDLIPNSNKTDKASMLDEAIEYLKTLQLQLQLMSMRTGMRLPPTVIPARMQHLHPLQIPCPRQLPIGLEMAHGMIDMAAATSMRPFIPYPSFPGAAHCESTPSPASAILDAFNQSSLMDSNSSCSTHQYLDLPSQPASMETYNPCMMYPQQHIQSQCAQQLLHLSQQQSMQTKIQQNRQLSFQHLQHINQE